MNIKLLVNSVLILIFLSFNSFSREKLILDKKNDLIIFKVPNKFWDQEISTNSKSLEAIGLLELKKAVIEFQVNDCNYQKFPILVKYYSENDQKNFSNYYYLRKENDFSLDVYNFSLNSKKIFLDKIEIDSAFISCLKNIHVNSNNSNIYNGLNIFRPKKINSLFIPDFSDSFDKKNYKLKYIDEIFFDKIHNQQVYYDINNEKYFLKNLLSNTFVKAGEKNFSLFFNDLYENCNNNFVSKFERNYLNRRINCSNIVDIAERSDILLDDKQILNFSGTIYSGSVFFVIKNLNGGVIDIRLINSGSFNEYFKIPRKGNYNLLISSNSVKYNYPFHDSELSIKLFQFK
jgi:hypothetical protein